MFHQARIKSCKSRVIFEFRASYAREISGPAFSLNSPSNPPRILMNQVGCPRRGSFSLSALLRGWRRATWLIILSAAGSHVTCRARTMGKELPSEPPNNTGSQSTTKRSPYFSLWAMRYVSKNSCSPRLPSILPTRSSSMRSRRDSSS